MNRINVKNILLSIVTAIICFIVIEAGYRIIDPFPYFSKWEQDESEHGSLLQYDAGLGWAGVSNTEESFVTCSAKIITRHNQSGFRDIDHKKNETKKEAIVFLGDSFTWGYEVNFDEMFVNILRKDLPDYEIFNLSHRGYGTDQSLLAFRQWDHMRPLKLTILMFCENDFDDNSSTYRYKKHKPRYELVGDELVLTNTPVPKDRQWSEANAVKERPYSFKEHACIIFKSHFIHDMYYRIKNLYAVRQCIAEEPDPAGQREKYILTGRIIKELRDEVFRRRGRLIVAAIPSKKEALKTIGYIPYQHDIEKICKSMDIDYLDLSGYFKKTRRRAYYRLSSHWNRHGNRIASDAIYKHIKGVL